MTASNSDRETIESDPERRIPRLSIRMTLAALVAACVVPALLALAAMVVVNYRAQETAVLDEAVTSARTMTLLVDGDLEGIESGLRVLAVSHSIAIDAFGRFDEHLREALKSQPVDSYVLFDREGRRRIDTQVAYGLALPKHGMPIQLEPVVATGKARLSGIVTGPGDEPPIVTMGVPVFQRDQVAYVLAATLTPDHVIASTRQTMPSGWVAAVIDGDGRIVARSREAARFVGQRATPSFLDAIAGKAEGTAETQTKEGDVVMLAFSRSTRSDWTVAVGAPKTLLVAALYRSVGLLAGIALLALALVLWFAFHVSQVVTRAVSSLIEPALALGNGRPIDLPPTPLRETDAVGRAIRQASRMLATAQHHAYHDPLTNLRNRTLFDEMASRQIAQAYRDGAQLAILAIDLDGFKAVNDRHGHAAGDLVLKIVADRITGLTRGSDVVSRRGGDEFSVLLVDVDGVKTRQVAEKLLAALARPYPDVLPSVSASIGVARYPHDATTLHELLERADEALYAAKNAGKRRVAGDF